MDEWMGGWESGNHPVIHSSNHPFRRRPAAASRFHGSGQVVVVVGRGQPALARVPEVVGGLVVGQVELFVYVLDEDSANEVIDGICHLITVYRKILDSRKWRAPCRPRVKQP